MWWTEEAAEGGVGEYLEHWERCVGGRKGEGRRQNPSRRGRFETRHRPLQVPSARMSVTEYLVASVISRISHRPRSMQ